MSADLSGRLLAVGYRSKERPDGSIKIEGHLPMSSAEAERFVAERESDRAIESVKRAPVAPVMWVERGPGGRPMVFWNDCTPAEIVELLQAINEDGKWQSEA